MIMKDLTDNKDKTGNSLIRLSLRKPREWKVALTTSVSSPAVIPPDIQLWDEERGDILLDTSRDKNGECLRSKSASFGSRSSKSPVGDWVGGGNWERSRIKTRKRDVEFTSRYLSADKPYQNGFRVQEDVKNRSKSSGRARPEVLVRPSDCVRPRTPVMVARRVSLPRDYSQTLPSDSCSSATSPLHNGIITHHRKQHSDSSVISSRRKVKNNVSFGRVDTIDDSSSISSSFNLNKARERHRKSIQSDSYSSSPKIVITEVVDSLEDGSKLSETPVEVKTKKVKPRSRSGIPVLKKNHRDSSIEGTVKPHLNDTSNPPITQNGTCGRRSRMELFMHEGPDKHRFSISRSPELPEPPPLLPPPAYHEQHFRHHWPCDRGNCPWDKYFCTPLPTRPSMKKALDERNNVHRNANGLKDAYAFAKTSLDKNHHGTKKHDVTRERNSQKKERSRTRSQKKRVPSRNRELMMSSSSSESEDQRTTPRPPRRRRRSQNPKGDRLVGVNGKCVRTPLEAEERLRNSGDVVHLQLQRHESLPVPAVEEPDTMGSNVSRHSGKGLTGRRSQSSGNLCNGKAAAPGVARFFSPCGRGAGDSVGPRDRYKFCGSLPNHLDTDPALEEVSEADDDSSYRNNNNVRALKKHDRDVVLRLQPLVPGHGRADSVTQDQGYASERSPEDELPPDLPPPATAGQLTCPVHHPASKPTYPFLHNNSTFSVTLVKGTRGLGLSVTGGVDTEEPWPGLIRVKRLFPHQPAWQSGQLAQGDFLLVANNTSLVGLTNYEALEVLRTAATEVVLTVCRPPPELQVLTAPTPAPAAPLPPIRDPHSTSSLQLPLKRMESFGEFELTLKKVNGSLGFTLRKEDESVLGHYVRALVREPALSDGRIRPGDKIVSVNGVDMSPMSHEEAVMFLRQCGQEVHLKLFRDPAQTPVQALSPTEHHRTFKPILRKEAQDMLSDLAVKKSMSPNESSGSSSLSNAGRMSSPRKRRLTKTPSPNHEEERPENHLSWSDEVLERVNPGFESDKPRRPDSLNFSAERKPHFQFSAAASSRTEESLNSLDSLDCCGSLAGMESELGVGPLPSEPVSMPPLLSSASDSTIGFSYRNPAYRSANPAPSKSKSSLSEDLPDNRCSDNDLTGGANSEGSVEGSKGLLKWKGVVFTPEDGAETGTVTPEDTISQITEVDNSSNQVLVVELNRGWNSRLGFSLQQSGHSTLISAIHPDSVASRDGRLKAGDQLIMVNDESVEGMSTTEVISLLRKIRGSICITVWRKSS